MDSTRVENECFFVALAIIGSNFSIIIRVICCQCLVGQSYGIYVKKE